MHSKAEAAANILETSELKNYYPNLIYPVDSDILPNVACSVQNTRICFVCRFSYPVISNPDLSNFRDLRMASRRSRPRTSIGLPQRRRLELNRGAVFNDTTGPLPSKPLLTVSPKERQNCKTLYSTVSNLKAYLSFEIQYYNIQHSSNE